MLVRLSIFAIGAALLVAMPVAAAAKEKTQQAGPEPILCEGLFGPDTSAARLIAHFGAENVVTGQIDGPEGTQMLGTTLFPADPARTMRITWFDEENLAYPGNVDLSPNQVAPGGLQIGMSIHEVEVLNGQPFKLSGFWWDYGGYAWAEIGNLFDPDPNCYIGMRFMPADNYPESLDTTPFAGEIELSSDTPLLDQIDPRLSQVSIGYAWPDHLPEPQY